MLKVGIVGLPNVGKSTLFNALTATKNAQSANYPFCTIEPNVGVVTVPDERLKVLLDLCKAKEIIPTVIEFVDIAGLVKGASKGEGLGNKFLANIRETDAIVHVVRCFEDTNIIHVDGSVNPLRDIETINLELVFSDLEVLERRLSRVIRGARNDKALAKEEDMFSGKTVFGTDAECEAKVIRHDRMLSAIRVNLTSNGEKRELLMCDFASAANFELDDASYFSIFI